MRAFLKISSTVKLKYDFDLNVNAGHVNDDLYLSDYSYGTESDLNTEIEIKKSSVNKYRNLQGHLTYSRNKESSSSFAEYYSLGGSYSKKLEQNVLPGTLMLDLLGNSVVNINRRNQLSRPPSSAYLGLDYSNSQNFKSLIFKNKSFVRLNSFVNSEHISSLHDELSFQYGLSQKISIPLIKLNEANKAILSPHIMLSFNDQEGNTNGNFFVGSDELSFGNLYAAKKFSSLSETESGLGFSVGVDYSLELRNQHSLDLQIAGAKISSSTYESDLQLGLTPRKFAFLTRVKYQNPNSLSLYGNALISNSGDVLVGDFTSKFMAKNLNLTGRYEYLNKKTDSRLLNNLENLELSASFDLLNNLSFKKEGRFNLRENTFAESFYGLNFSSGSWVYQFGHSFLQTEPDNISLAATYEDNCTRVMVTLENNFPELGSFEKIQSLEVKVSLKSFASF